MSKFLTPLINEDITYKYSRIHEPFRFYSEVLKCEVEVPPGFVHDFESVPIIKGTSKRGGVGHDYLSRTDSVPVVSKGTAAAVYFELCESRDGLADKETALGSFNLWWRRWVKWGVVRIWPGYFHKFEVMASYEEISGCAKSTE